MSVLEFAMERLWQHAWALIPLALLGAAACRWLATRPATRHAVWLAVLAWFVMPLVLPAPPVQPVASVRTVPRGVANAIELPAEPFAPLDPAAPRTPPPSARGLFEASAPMPHADDRRAADDRGANEPRAVRIGTAQTSRDGLKPERNPASRVAPRRGVPTRRSSPTPNHFRAFERTLTPDRPQRERPAIVFGDEQDEQEHTAGDAFAVAPPTAGASAPSAAVSVAAPVASDAVAPATVAPGESGRDGARTWSAWAVNSYAAWLASFAGVRAALARVPSLPGWIWAAGVALALLWNIAGILNFRRRTRRAVRASQWVERETALVARHLGMSRVPDVRLIAHRMSPLVWCGWRTRLYLPLALWEQLDRVGRRAILCHELAHLRRRDHWVCWLTLLIGVFYWWHPVVWYVRRRIHDEADAACDAWVTWLMPRGRRAYAEALLKTRQFIDVNSVHSPAAAMAVTSAGARDLYRRLTMVMTRSDRPRASWMGVILAGGLLFAGWVVTPALSCPPEEQETEAAVEAVQAEPRASAQTYQTRVRQRLAETAAGAAVIADGEMIIRRYELPKGKLEALTALMSRSDVPVLVAPADDAIEVHGTAEQHERFAAFVELIASESRWESHALPQGKRDALYELMSRDDVPIYVRQEADGMGVNGNDRAQRVFAAFVAMIHPDGASPGQKPKPRRGGRAAGAGSANAVAQAEIAAALGKVQALGGKLKGVERVISGTTAREIEAAARRLAEVEAQRAPGLAADAEARARADAAARDAEAALADRVRAKARERIERLERQMQTLRERLEELRREADRLRSESSRLSDEADDAGLRADEESEPTKRSTLRKHVRTTERQARTLENRAEALEERAEEFEAQLDQLEMQQAEVDEHAATVEDALEMFREHLAIAGSDDADALSDSPLLQQAGAYLELVPRMVPVLRPGTPALAPTTPLPPSPPMPSTPAALSPVGVYGVAAPLPAPVAPAPPPAPAAPRVAQPSLPAAPPAPPAAPSSPAGTAPATAPPASGSRGVSSASPAGASPTRVPVISDLVERLADNLTPMPPGGAMMVAPG